MEIPNKELSAALKRLYNEWFKYWRDRVSEQRWQEMMQEGYNIVHEYDQYPVVWNIFISLLYELSARLTGGYTDTTRNKILSIIQGGGYGSDRNRS